MNRITKAPKTNRNQPSDFDETLATSFSMPVSVSGRSRLTIRQIRLGLGVVWVAAALLAGVGVGRMIKDAAGGSAGAVPPAPIALAKVTVANAAPGSISRARAISVIDMKVAPAAAISQAQSGSVFITASVASLQDTNSFNALQPGYNNFVTTQGNIGTNPVR